VIAGSASARYSMRSRRLLDVVVRPLNLVVRSRLGIARMKRLPRRGTSEFGSASRVRARSAPLGAIPSIDAAEVLSMGLLPALGFVHFADLKRASCIKSRRWLPVGQGSSLRLQGFAERGACRPLGSE
jgi:hypothetical protein